MDNGYFAYEARKDKFGRKQMVAGCFGKPPRLKFHPCPWYEGGGSEDGKQLLDELLEELADKAARKKHRLQSTGRI